ncbi:SPOR domain-containing protein [Desulfosarcina variabilis]|uniref:SPOR domain-containing protein n=1 Tax=Desulfosarcina variabilis TaxID=2300 RepID=UPI003AFA1D2E
MFSSGCKATENDKNKERLAVDQVVGNKIDEDEAMLYLFETYNLNEKIARWCPSENSKILQYLYSKGRISELESKMAFSAHYEENGDPHFFIIIQTERYFDSCHACTVVLGGAIFIEKEDIWSLKAFNPSITNAGSWGLAPNSMELVKIGRYLHAVVVRDGYTSQGVYQENLIIIGPVGDRVEQLFFLHDISGENKGICEPNLENNGFYHRCYFYDATIIFHHSSHFTHDDIEVVIEGTKEMDYNTVTPYMETSYHRFNGCSYVKNSTFDLSYDKPFYIQVAAFEKYQSAKSLANKLNNLGYKSYCVFHKIDNRKSLFRVRIGNYENTKKLDHDLKEINKMGYDGFVSAR